MSADNQALQAAMDILDPSGTLHAAVARKQDEGLRAKLTALLEHGATRHDGEWWVPVPEAVDTVMDWLPGGAS